MSDDTGKDRFAFLMAREQVHADFVFHRPALEGLFREPAAAEQRARVFGGDALDKSRFLSVARSCVRITPAL
ncbi:MAG: hypothetical protein OXB98_14475 [Bryobacterales bacterium]|nr:hypothetical protein [Bryobacterales bacterium]